MSMSALTGRPATSSGFSPLADATPEELAPVNRRSTMGHMVASAGVERAAEAVPRRLRTSRRVTGLIRHGLPQLPSQAKLSPGADYQQKKRGSEASMVHASMGHSGQTVALSRKQS